MKYLFIHQNFPGQYLHLLRHLAAQEKHELLFLTEAKHNALPGVRKLIRAAPKMPQTQQHELTRELDYGLRRADAVVSAGRSLKALGFEPDVILGHQGWGELIHINDVWPKTPVIGYHEFYYNAEGFDVDFDPEFPAMPDMAARMRAKNLVNLMVLANPGWGQTPTQFQLSSYPEWARPRIKVLPEGVNLDICRPDPAVRQRVVSLAGCKVRPAEKLITYVVRDLEPYRGFHMIMRALPKILQARPDARVILVGADGVSYGTKPPFGTWREHMLNELAGQLDITRVHFAGRVPYDTYVKLLQRSDVHVYLTYPFVASWSLREAMACGCALVASDTEPVREFVTDRKTGLLAPFLQPDVIADRILELLEDQRLAGRLRRAARAWAQTHLDMNDYLTSYEALIAQAINNA